MGNRKLSSKYDSHNRVRSEPVTVRMSPEEHELLKKYVAVSGLTKQDYITDRLLNRDVLVKGNPRVYKALREQMNSIAAELERINNAGEISDEFIEFYTFVISVFDAMKSNAISGIKVSRKDFE